MCDLKQDTCLFGHGGVDPARTQVSPGVFGSFLHCDNCDKNRQRHLVLVFGTQRIVCVLLCFIIIPMLGNRYGPGVIGTWGGRILTLHLN